MVKDFASKLKEILKDTVNKLKGSEKRKMLARITQAYGTGGQSFVTKEFNVGRDTIRKGMRELNSGIECKDAFNMRGRKKITNKLPKLCEDIKSIAESQCQIDPKFQSTRVYTRLTVGKIREDLITKKNYDATELPTNQTLTNVTNQLGYHLKSILKTTPLKKLPETNEIFDHLKKVHEEIQKDDTVVWLSIDAKDRVKIGNFSRRGKSRVQVKAGDHDFGDKFATPFGIMDVKIKQIDISIATSKITADYIVDRLEEYWNEKDTQGMKVLFLNIDNGPESHSRRTQFIKRMVQFAVKYDVEVRLAYYPPYHSKYNPIEHVWGTLEQHWNGDILDSLEAVVGFAKSMNYKGKHPTVKVVNQIYETGKKLPSKVMDMYEKALDRMKGIGKYFVSIKPSKCKEVLDMELLV